jgi:ribosomal protein L40E
LRINSIIWLSIIGVFFLIISFFLPYFSGAEDFGLPSSAYSLGYWPHLISSESIPIFDGESLAHRFVILEIIGIIISSSGIILLLFNREKYFRVSNEILVISGGVISFGGVGLAIDYGLNNYKLGWVQIFDIEIGVWVALGGSTFIIMGAIVNKVYNNALGKFRRKPPEPILFRDVSEHQIRQKDFKAPIESSKKRGKNTESVIINKNICQNCGKSIPRKVTQCPHCFYKIM